MTIEEEKAFVSAMKLIQERMLNAKKNNRKNDYYECRYCYETMATYFASVFIKYGFKSEYE